MGGYPCIKHKLLKCRDVPTVCLLGNWCDSSEKYSGVPAPVPLPLFQVSSQVNLNSKKCASFIIQQGLCHFCSSTWEMRKGGHCKGAVSTVDLEEFPPSPLAGSPRWERTARDLLGLPFPSIVWWYGGGNVGSYKCRVQAGSGVSLILPGWAQVGEGAASPYGHTGSSLASWTPAAHFGCGWGQEQLWKSGHRLSKVEQGPTPWPRVQDYDLCSCTDPHRIILPALGLLG